MGFLDQKKKIMASVFNGPFQRHVCDQKSGKFHFWMATAPGTNMLSTNFWLIIVHPVRVKTYRSSKIKFFVKVKNKVHVTIGHVCDFARNYGPAQNDFKVKILWCVIEFCIEQYTDDGQHIYKQFHILRMKEVAIDPAAGWIRHSIEWLLTRQPVARNETAIHPAPSKISHVSQWSWLTMPGGGDTHMLNLLSKFQRLIFKSKETC